MVVKDLAPGSQLRVRLEMEGYKTITELVTFPKGRQLARARFVLEPNSAQAPAPEEDGSEKVPDDGSPSGLSPD